MDLFSYHSCRWLMAIVILGSCVSPSARANDKVLQHSVKIYNFEIACPEKASIAPIEAGCQGLSGREKTNAIDRLSKQYNCTTLLHDYHVDVLDYDDKTIKVRELDPHSGLVLYVDRSYWIGWTPPAK